jgi:hypothetical protein
VDCLKKIVTGVRTSQPLSPTPANSLPLVDALD